ncbi:hypothetical protein [Amycolatopsis sp. Hca4]|uniref:hypothetical protein n=1 Tax=Amycolatopsis sp. Hca4 TaxID=2742131 RepID=UPI0015912BC6|nr:hypothetical protein [Amycolatopsis sp. Hca4]QKV80430.1 hypothetical protein HUT10_46595 [Amycolatopsis sp. Hca4]
MTFALWYQVAVTSPGSLAQPVTVSNDVLAGSLVLDAEITVTMTEGAATDTFEVVLINLPTDTADLVRAAQATTAVTATIRLGYFDDVATRTGDGGLVLVGRVTRVVNCVGEDGYGRTILYGQEEAGYLLRNTPAAGQATGTDAVRFARDLVRRAGGVQLAPNSTLPGDLTGFTVRTGSTLDALGALATRAAVPLVVRDGDVFLGDAVGAATDTAPVAFDPDTNIVSLHSLDGEDTASTPAPPVHSTLSMTVLGHPLLRVGQVAKVTGLSGVPSGTLRISRVLHRFTTDGGYVARLELIAAEAGRRAQVTTGVQVVVDRWRELVDRAQDDRPAIDVGEVTEYTADGHVASLQYAQQPDPAVAAPSVAGPVDGGTELHGKPISSAFAFDRTGLVVPVYPRMRALLAHNRGLVNDAVLAGFLWTDEPELRRPANRPGDHWLALPTGLGPDGLPTGPGVNDLTDATGHRVIQAAGLRVQVGAGTLPEVGTRPDPPSDGSITIEHESGTRIRVGADGGVTITTDHQPITLTNGGVSLKLDGTKVAVS